MSTTKRTSSAALLSVAAGLLFLASANLLWPPLMTISLAMLAIVSGHIAKSAIRRSPDLIEGNAIAITGLVIGYVGLAAGLSALLLLNLGFMIFGGR